jgi:hypothetical protein
MRLFICFHIGYHSVIPDIFPYFDDISKNKDLFEQVFFLVTYQYVSLRIKELQERLSSEFLVYFFKVPKRGQDVGGFLYCLNEILDRFLIQEDDFTLCIHTKSKKEQMKTLLDSLFKDFRSTIRLFDDSSVGIVGSKKYLIQLDLLNVPDIESICSVLNIKPYFLSDTFIAGKIFIMRLSIIDRLMNRDLIKKFYEELEDEYYIENTKSTKIHSWERMFGILARHLNYRVVGIDT